MELNDVRAGVTSVLPERNERLFLRGWYMGGGF
jgi:hypothetical protein